MILHFTVFLFYDKILTKRGEKMDKKLLRREIKSKREQLLQEYIKNASEEIEKRLLGSDSFINANKIFIYISAPKEVFTHNIIKKALSDKKEVFIPKCINSGIMNAVKITADTVFSEGYMGIYEPEETGIPAEECEFDIIVMPCISTDKNKNRLGYGGGFYDRFVEKCKAQKICLCFNELLCEHIPSEPNDIKPDIIITEKEIF